MRANFIAAAIVIVCVSAVWYALALAGEPQAVWLMHLLGVL